MKLIIGNDDCKYIDVWNVMTNSVAADRLYNDWQNLARQLEVPSDIVVTLQQQVRSGSNFKDVIYEILQAWRATFSESANLGNLVATLEKCRLHEVSEALRRRFNYHNGEISPRRFAERSSSCSAFVYSSDITFIVSTPAPSVTYSKIREAAQVPISELLSEDEYLPQAHVQNHQRNVILSSEPKKFLSKCKQFRNKVTILTQQTKGTLKQKLKNMINVKIKRDHLQWSYLTSSFQEEIRNGCDILKRIDDCSLEKILDDDLLFELLLQDKKTRHFKETIPEHKVCNKVNNNNNNNNNTQYLYYVSRTIISRHNLSVVNLFGTLIPDNVFVFTGFEKHELSIYSKLYLTDVSTNQLVQEELSVSFILLDNTDDFDLIANKTSKPVHWLQRENDKLVWKRSIRSMAAIQKFVEKEQQKYSETEFIRHLDSNLHMNNNATVCISDKPGMGKSMLLLNIARRLLDENKIVFYIVISQFLNLIKSLGNFSEPCKETLSESICSYVTCSPFGKQVMRALLESKTTKLEVLFDGVDEIPAQELKFLLNCFRLINKSFPSVRLWITTRPNHLNQIENELHVFGYNISSLDYEEQLEFLTNFWRLSEPKKKLDEKKLKDFGIACLKALTDIGNPTGGDFPGMPFQCFLIARVYSEEAIKYSKHDKIVSGNTFPTISLESIASLFDIMVYNSFKTYFTIYKRSDLPITNVDLTNAHIYKAMELLFPEWLPKLKRYFAFTHLLTDIENVGIMGFFSSNVELTFIHRTFAEYFVGKLTTSLLKVQEDSNAMQFCYQTVFKNTEFRSDIRGYGQNYLCKTVVATFEHNVICFFVENMPDYNMKLKMDVDNELDRKKQRSYVQRLSIACAYHGYLKIFTALNATSAFQLYQADIFDRNMLFVTTLFGNSCFVDLVLSNFYKITGIPLNTVMENDYANLLHVTVKRGNYRIFDLLFKRYSFSFWVDETPRTLLMHTCIEHSKFDSMEVVNDKLQIIKALHYSKRLIIEERDNENHTAIVCRDAHVLLLIGLINMNANLFALRSNSDTFLHSAACYLSVEEFKELILAIPKVSLKLLLSKKGTIGRTPLHTLVSFLDPDSQLLGMFAKFGADFRTVDNCMSTILSAAIENRCKNLDDLVRYGADLEYINKNGDTLLHTAVKVGNLHAVKFLIDRGADVNARNCILEAPFHFAAHHECACITELVNIFIRQGVNVNVNNKFGETAFHYVLKNPCLKSVKFVYGFHIFENLLTDIKYFYYAVEESPVETVKFLTDYYINVLGKVSLPFLDFGPDNHSFLHAAMTDENNSQLVQYQSFKNCLHLPKMQNLVHKVWHLIASCDENSGSEDKIKTMKICSRCNPTLQYEPEDEIVRNTKFG